MFKKVITFLLMLTMVATTLLLPVKNNASAATTNVLLNPAVFNVTYYRNRYRDLRSLTDVQLRNHWVNNGIRERRQAHLKFSWTEYRLMYADLRNAFGTDGKKFVSHYARRGQIEHRTPVYALDPSVFSATYLALHDSNLVGLTSAQIETYWLTHGMMAGLQGHPLFHSQDYYRIYPDIANAFGNNPYKLIRHYVLRIAHGPENRVGVPEIHPFVFDGNYYRNTYSDAANLSANQIKMRWIQDLAGNIDRSASKIFNPKDYQELNPASSANRRQAVRQYVFNNSITQASHRFFDSEFFDVGEYQTINQDLSSLTWMQAKQHWLNHGMKEGRRAKNTFLMRNYINDENPWLRNIFGTNYDLAWDFYVNFEKKNRYDLLPLPNPDDFETSNKTLFCVDEYGADPTGQTDSTPAVVAALNEIKEYQNAHPGETVVLLFDSGTYRFTSAQATGTHPNNPYNKSGYLFLLQNFNNLIIAGTPGQTKLINTHASTGTFFLRRCSSVYFRDLCLDYSQMAYLQGTIARTDIINNVLTITLIPENSFARISDAALNQSIDTGFAIVFDHKRKGVRKRNTSSFYRISSIVKVDNVYKMAVSADSKASALMDLRAGDDFVFVKRTAGKHTMMLRECDTLGFHNIEVNAAPCLDFAFVANRGNITIDKVVIKPSANRPRSIVTSTADGIHAQSNRGAFTIQNCYFQGLADDGINLYAAGSVVLEKSGNTLTVNYPLWAEVGDVVQFASPQSGSVLGHATVQTVSNSVPYTYTFNTIPASVTGGAMPDLTQPYTNTIAYNVSSCNRGSRIVNNIFGPIRRTGILNTAPYSTIEKNIFMDIDVNAVQMNNLFRTYTQGPTPQHITITRNRFSGSLSSTDAVVYAGNRPFAPGQQCPIRDINVIDNEFLSSGTEAVHFVHAMDCLIQENIFESNGQDERNDWNAQPQRRSVIELESCGSNIDILDNDFEDNRKYTNNNVGVL